MSSIRYRTRSQGRHRKPRQPRTNALIRGGLLSGVVGTVAVTGTSAHPAFAAGPQDTATSTAELPVIDRVLADSAAHAAAATEAYADEAGARQEREQAQEQAIDEAQRLAAERREREERRAAAAAEAEARAEAQARAEAEAAAAAAAEAEAQAAAEAEAEAQNETQSSTAPAPVETTTGSGAEAVVSYVRAQLGDGYSMGAAGPDVWDCSSLVQAAYSSVGVSLPRVAADQSTTGTQVSLDALLPGDILYWGGAGSAYHVAIYVGDGMFIGAQNSSTGVVERTLDWDPPAGAVRVL